MRARHQMSRRGAILTHAKPPSETSLRRVAAATFSRRSPLSPSPFMSRPTSPPAAIRRAALPARPPQPCRSSPYYFRCLIKMRAARMPQDTAYAEEENAATFTPDLIDVSARKHYASSREYHITFLLMFDILRYRMRLLMTPRLVPARRAMRAFLSRYARLCSVATRRTVAARRRQDSGAKAAARRRSLSKKRSA